MGKVKEPKSVIALPVYHESTQTGSSSTRAQHPKRTRLMRVWPSLVSHPYRSEGDHQSHLWLVEGLSVCDADSSWSMATASGCVTKTKRPTNVIMLDRYNCIWLNFSRGELMWVSLLFSGAQLQNSKMSVHPNEMSWQSGSAYVFLGYQMNCQ